MAWGWVGKPPDKSLAPTAERREPTDSPCPSHLPVRGRHGKLSASRLVPRNCAASRSPSTGGLLLSASRRAERELAAE
jgi:hypothetical protein